MKNVTETEKQKRQNEISIRDSWDPYSELGNVALAGIYYHVPEFVRVRFDYDFRFPGENKKCIYLLPNGSAEMAFIPLGTPWSIEYVMNLAPNELFDPKDEGVIFLQADTHEMLRKTAEVIVGILEDMTSQKSV